MIFGFGVLKYFPGVSPAQDLVLSTTRVLSFGLMPAHVALVLLATVECGIGLSLLTGRGLRVSIYLTALWVMGILSPLVVLPGRLFSAPTTHPPSKASTSSKTSLCSPPPSSSPSPSPPPSAAYRRPGNEAGLTHGEGRHAS